MVRKCKPLVQAKQPDNIFIAPQSHQKFCKESIDSVIFKNFNLIYCLQSPELTCADGSRVGWREAVSSEF